MSEKKESFKEPPNLFSDINTNIRNLGYYIKNIGEKIMEKLNELESKIIKIENELRFERTFK